MILPIVLYGDPVLRKKCKPVTEITDDIKELAENMIETMIEAHGVGLAAPQIGIPIQLAIVDVSHDLECISYLRINDQDLELEDCMPLVFVNPKLEPHSVKELCEEGCLSIPELRGNVKRPADLTAHLELLNGETIKLETDGLLARAIQHETDHLNGILFVDRLSSAGKLKAKRDLKRLQRDW